MDNLDRLANSGVPAHMRLYYFVKDVEELLDQVTAARHVLLAKPLRESVHKAWQEYRATSLPELLTGLEAWTTSTSGSEDRSLRTAGLQGSQLDAKLAGYVEARRHLVAAGGRLALKRTLRWVNTILGSLATVVPVAEALKELKECYENGAQDVEDLERGPGAG